MVVGAARVAGTMITRPTGARNVPAMISTTKSQTRRNVLSLYRAWYRQLPFMLMDYDVQVDLPRSRLRLKEIFRANKDVRDLRAIDLLVAKGQMELRETLEVWKQKTHFMTYFKDTQEKKPQTFLAKFLDGQN